MKVYNTKRLNQNQRFIWAVMVGTVAAIALGIAVAALNLSLPITSSLFLVGAGYLLALVIQKVGRGVQVRFSILGAVLAVVMILVADIVTYTGGFEGLLAFSSYKFIFSIWFMDGIDSVMLLIYRVIAVYIAYNYSRFI